MALTHDRPSTSLLPRLLAEPQLLERVRELDAPQLGRLVHSVGLEDAGELVALASTEQLTELFDEDLWGVTDSDAGSSEQEEFDAERFLLWLEVLSEAGEAAVARRLCELSFEFVCAAFSKVVLVLDMDALASDVAAQDDSFDGLEKALDGCLGEEWEEFRVIARYERGWDAVWAALLALDEQNHDLLRRVLERCVDTSSRYIEQFDDLSEALSSEELLVEDARAERDDRRAKRGHVSHADARAFLKAATRGVEYAERDPFTAAYFRDLPPAPAVAKPTGAIPRLLQALAETQAEPEPERATATAEPLPETTSLAPVLESPWRDALDRLRSNDTKAAALRLEELGYVANVLVTLSNKGQRHLRPIEAAELVLATLDSGAPLDPEDVRLDAARATHTIDAHFRKAWQKWCAAGCGDLPVSKDVLGVARELAAAHRD